MNSNIGENIKNLRDAKNMTQSELAERVGMTKATISAYENSTRLPSYDVLIKIAYLFHVSTDNLLGFSNKYTIDVSLLSAKQRNVIQEIISLYELKNEKYKEALDAMVEDSIHGEMLAAGVVNEFDIEEYKKNMKWGIKTEPNIVLFDNIHYNEIKQNERFDNSMAQYAIAFDMDTKQMKADGITDSHRTSIYQKEISEVLASCGFTAHPQGSLYHTEVDHDPIVALMTIQSALKENAPSFCKYAKRIHIFRMEEWSDVTEIITGKKPADIPTIDEDIEKDEEINLIA